VECNTNATRKNETRYQSGFQSLLADRTGLEPATSAVTGQHSNQLNYRSYSGLSLQKTPILGGQR
jgi:hypothetical protein